MNTLSEKELIEFLYQLTQYRKKQSDILLHDLPVFVWTGPKSHLIELIYSLYASKYINNGDIEIAELCLLFSRIFRIEIKNPYSCFRDIRQRKNNTLRGLDDLKKNLLAHIIKTYEDNC